MSQVRTHIFFCIYLLTRVLLALSFVQREALFGHGDHDIEMPDAPDYYSVDWQDVDSDDEEALQRLPPGEEGYYHSHAGKEAVFQEIFNKCQPGCVCRAFDIHYSFIT